MEHRQEREQCIAKKCAVDAVFAHVLSCFVVSKALVRRADTQYK